MQSKRRSEGTQVLRPFSGMENRRRAGSFMAANPSTSCAATRQGPDASGWNSQVWNASPVYSSLRAAPGSTRLRKKRNRVRARTRSPSAGPTLKDLQQVVVLVEKHRPPGDEITQAVQSLPHVPTDKAGLEIIGQDLRAHVLRGRVALQRREVRLDGIDDLGLERLARHDEHRTGGQCLLVSRPNAC